ncbi:hypothetical protein ES703_109221 [subsurface metagenome]
MRRIIIVYKWALESYIWYPIVIFESQLLATLLLIVMIFRPNGLIPEKLLRIPGIDYKRLVTEEVEVDWRIERKEPSERGGLLSRITGGGKKKEEAE